jgi:hypothetical protein
LRKASLSVVDDTHDFIPVIRDLCDNLYLYTRSWRYFYVLNSISAQLIFLGQIIEFGASQRVFVDYVGDCHIGYVSAVFSPVYLHHIFLYS